MRWPQSGRKEEERLKEPEKEIETVIFIAFTPEGTLKKRLQSEDDAFAKTMGLKRVRFVERGGTTLAAILCKSNPWQDKACARKDCMLCNSGNLGECRTESVVYEVECQICKQQGLC